MRLLALVAALAACSKEPAKSAQPPVEKGPMAVRVDPGSLPPPGTAPPPAEMTSTQAAIWDAPIHTLKGAPTTLAAYKGKALMFVNVASQCGNTPQYATLEALQKKYEPKGFTVIGFPCNQFGGQEPGTAEEISTFCATNYGITFPIMEKIEVNGAGAHPIYKALEPIADASGHTGDIRWNFEKFGPDARHRRVLARDRADRGRARRRSARAAHPRDRTRGDRRRERHLVGAARAQASDLYPARDLRRRHADHRPAHRLLLLGRVLDVRRARAADDLHRRRQRDEARGDRRHGAVRRRADRVRARDRARLDRVARARRAGARAALRAARRDRPDPGDHDRRDDRRACGAPPMRPRASASSARPAWSRR
jgi:glutathione peroxidase